MPRKIVVWLACLAVPVPTPGSSFAIWTNTSIRRPCSRGPNRKGDWPGHVIRQETTAAKSSLRRLTGRGDVCCEAVNRDPTVISRHGERGGPNDPGSRSTTKHDVGTATDGIQALRIMIASFLGIAMLVCPLATSTFGAHADSDVALEQAISPELPSQPRKPRQPPPQIPPGRITIVQWVSRIKFKLLPDKIDFNSATKMAVEDLNKMAQEARHDFRRPFPDALVERQQPTQQGSVGNLASVKVKDPLLGLWPVLIASILKNTKYYCLPRIKAWCSLERRTSVPRTCDTTACASIGHGNEPQTSDVLGKPDQSERSQQQPRTTSA